jgi:charged multivesicular body protein 7
MELLEFLRTHEEAFRRCDAPPSLPPRVRANHLDSRARLASLYSDFRFQRSTNPDGYQANSAAWIRALVAGSKAGLIPSSSSAHHDRFVLHSGEELSRALQTQEYGRPLALGAAIEDAVRNKEFIQLKQFLDAKQSVYASSWLPTPWQIVNWTLRQLGVKGESNNDTLVSADFVIMPNVEVSEAGLLGNALLGSS